VMRIANTLASYFMDENLKVREAQAVGTSEFLQSELEKNRKELEDRERELSDYKKKYIGGLPDELDTNLRTLDRLQRLVANKNGALRQMKASLNMLETQIKQSNEMASQSFNDPFSSFDFEDESGPGFETSENAQKLTIVKKRYDTLLFKYTERHPDVVKLKKIIEKLEKSIEEEVKAQEEAVPEGETEVLEETGDAQSSELGMPNFAALQQETQLKQIKAEINKIQSDIIKIENQMKIYQLKIEETPKRELELQILKRDYGHIKRIFDSLLKRKLEAELSVNMEKKQKGEQFRILDHARLPERPTSPDVRMLFMLSIASGLGVGAGIIFLLEVLNTSIRREEQIENDLGLTILAIIPPLKSRNYKTKRRAEITAFASCAIYAAVMFLFFAILNYKGLDRTLNFIKATLNI
jgi:polysaccharide chain length determinant protein (PEP-CTERM system associated)